MLNHHMNSCLLVLALLLGLFASGCGGGSSETTTPPPAPTATTSEKETPKLTESKNESEAIQMARKLGTPTDKPVVTTKSGLQYIDVKVGEGTPAAASNIVDVHYTGWLVDGTQFDSSLDRGKPINFILSEGRVIKGWDEGVAGMKPGGVRKLIIPSNLAYGSSPPPGAPIPPNATLIFEVQLIKIQQ